MFTGLVESIGTVKTISEMKDSQAENGGAVVRLAIHCDSFACELGASVAVNGCCLSVTESEEQILSFDVSPESMERTNLSHLKTGDKVNLEQALKLNGRLGGHLVSGHVDAVGLIKQLNSSKEAWTIRVSFAKEWASLVIFKGSICINGVSLTINSVLDTDKTCEVTMCLIPITVAETNLAHLKLGCRVNLEFDMLGKYMMRQAEVGNA